MAFFIFFSPRQVYSQSDSTIVKVKGSFLEGANNQYQMRIGSKTIHRCPFEVTCSHFLTKSVEQHGIFKGTALFLDRYFYRENKFVPMHYESIIRYDKVVYRDEIPDSLIIYLYSD